MTQTTVAEALNAAFLKARDLDAPVNARLANYADALRRHQAPFAQGVDRLVERLQSVAAGSEAPKVGEPMPPFLLPDDTGRLISSDEILSAGPAAIAFHRGHWCPYCRINARALAQVDAQVRMRGGQIVAITPERQHYTQQHKASAEAKFVILSDIDNGYALSLNLAIWVGDEVKKLMMDFGRDLDLYQGNSSWFLPIPATFIVARDGTITARFVDPDYRRRMDLEDLLVALKKAG